MYVFGIAVGMAVSAAVLAVIIKMIRKATHKEGTFAKYDERQQVARGKAFRLGFFTMVILSAMAMCWYSAADGDMVQIPVAAAFLAVFLAGFLAFGSFAIWSDAYIGTNETYRSSVLLFAVIAAINLAIGIMNFSLSGWDTSYINLSVGVMMLVLDIEMVAKYLIDKRTTDSEE